MQKTSKLSEVYSDLSLFISRNECGRNIEPNLASMRNIARNYKDSSDLNSLNIIAESLERQNRARIIECKLW